MRGTLDASVFFASYTKTRKTPQVFQFAHTTLAKVSLRARARCQAPSTPNCGRRHRLSARDAARGTIDAASGRMIDRRGSLVKAETEGGVLLRRAMATSRKCVLRPCSLDEPRVSPPPRASSYLL